jgi:hypothetical protein
LSKRNGHVYFYSSSFNISLLLIEDKAAEKLRLKKCVRVRHCGALVVPALMRLRQEGHKIEASLDYINEICLKKIKRTKPNQHSRLL